MDILRLEKITNEKWLNLYSATFRHNDHEGRWVFASRKPTPHAEVVRADAVVMVATLLNPGEPPRLVVIREYRVPIGGRMYGFPAGLLEAGESLEEAARREMIEETGYEVTRVKGVTPPLVNSAGISDETAAVVFVDVRSTPDSKPHLEASEDIEVLLWDFEQVCEQSRSATTLFDAKTWFVLHLCQMLGRII